MRRPTWQEWFRSYWGVIEPAMRQGLQRALGAPRCMDEFDDIIQEFVAYLMGSDQTLLEIRWGTEPTRKVLDTVVMWCVRRGMSLRGTSDRRKEGTYTHFGASPEEPWIADGHPDPEQLLMDAEEALHQEDVLRALPAKLPPSLRQVLQMYLAGQGRVHIAEELGRTAASVSTDIRRISQTAKRLAA